MDKVIPFDFNGQNFKVAMDGSGNPWFFAKDACDILELSDVSMSLQKLDDDEKLIQKLFVSGQMRDTWTVNESGLYTLIFRSNKPEAKKFRRWVTHEVLPALRRTGRYSVGGAENLGGSASGDKLTFSRLAREFSGAKLLAERMGLSDNPAILAANATILDVLGVDCMDLLGVTLPDPTGDAREAALDLLREILSSRVTDDGTRRSVADVLALRDPNETLPPYGLRRLARNRLFVHPVTVQRGLLHGTFWAGQDLRKTLLALREARAQQLRLNGTPVRGVAVELPVTVKTVVAEKEVLQ